MEKANEASLTKEQIENYSENYRLVRHAVEELVRAGIPVGDTNDEIPIGDYVINLLVAYAKQRHMPLTTHVTMKLFIDLANGWALTPLTLGEEEFSDNGTGIEFNTRDKRILRWKKTGEMFNQEAYICKILLLKDLGIDKVHTAPENMIPQTGPLFLHKDGIATGRYLALHSCIIDKSKAGSYKVPDPIIINVIGVEHERGHHVLFCDEDDIPFKRLSEEYDVRIQDRPKLKGKSIYNVTFEDLFSTDDNNVQSADA